MWLAQFDAAAPAPPDFDTLPILSFGERESETTAAAVPVFSQRDGLIGALTLSGPMTRFTPERVEAMKALLLTAGRRLSEALGGSYPGYNVALRHEQIEDALREPYCARLAIAAHPVSAEYSP